MKKFIILLIVLALVNVANAGIVDIVISSLNGQPIDPVSEITIAPTDVINFDIVYYGPVDYWLFGVGASVIVDGPGTLDGSEPTYPAGIWDMAISEIIDIGPQELGISLAPLGFGVPGTGDPENPAIVLDHLLMHCDDLGNVYLTIVNNPDMPAGTSYETDGMGLYDPEFGPGVVIHQIPEPMTLTLLGLGGLFLVRRKK